MMRNLVSVFIVMACMLFGCIGEPEKAIARNVEQTEEIPVKTIVALGDSLTAGFGVDLSESYPSLLETKLKANGYDYRVINAGVSGETSSGTLARLEWILTQKPDIVIVETGANDGLRGVTTDLLEENLRQIVTILQERNVAVLVAGMQMVWNLGPEYVAEFNATYPQIAREKGVELMPFFLEDVATRSNLNQGDGIHPNAEGYKVIVENIYPYVIRVIESVNS
ncbi:arylesterase [Desulforhopalus sp. 52FAK]